MSTGNSDIQVGPPRRIGLLIGSLEIGGAQRMLMSLALGLMEAGWDVKILLIDDIQHIAFPGDPSQQDALRKAIRVLRPPWSGASRQGTIGKVLGMGTRYCLLGDMVRRERLSLIVSFMERANILSLMSPVDVPRIISSRKHLPMALAEKSWLKRNLVVLAYSLLLHRANAVVCNSTESSRGFKTLFPRLDVPVVTIPNAVEMRVDRVIGEKPEGLRKWHGRPMIAAMGRFRPTKGFVPLLRAFSRIRKACPEAVLVIIGDGPDRAKLQATSVALGVADAVDLPGFLEEPHPWLAYTDLFVLSSRAEGCPNALLEAMSLGLPVVAADCPSGPRELLAPSSDPTRKTKTIDWAPYGVLVPRVPDTDLTAGELLTSAETLLADAVVGLLKDPPLRERYAAAAEGRARELAAANVLRLWEGEIERTSTDP